MKHVPYRLLLNLFMSSGCVLIDSYFIIKNKYLIEHYYVSKYIEPYKNDYHRIIKSRRVNK